MSTRRLTGDARLTDSPRHLDWGRVEQHLATQLPEDYYCELAAAGGAGLSFDTLRLFSPGEPVRSRERLGRATADTARSTIFWRVDPGVAPENFPIYILDADYERFERFDLTATEFMTGLSNGTLDSCILSEVVMGPP